MLSFIDLVYITLIVLCSTSAVGFIFNKYVFSNKSEPAAVQEQQVFIPPTSTDEVDKEVIVEICKSCGIDVTELENKGPIIRGNPAFDEVRLKLPTQIKKKYGLK